MNTVKVESVTTTVLTPQVIAQAFWHMTSDQQAEFFEELAKQTKASYEKNKGKWFSSEFGDMQWCILAGELKSRPEAQKQYMAMSAFAFEFVPQRWAA